MTIPFKVPPGLPAAAFALRSLLEDFLNGLGNPIWNRFGFSDFFGNTTSWYWE